MTLYRKEKFDITEEKTVIDKLFEVELDLYGIVITSSIHPDKSLYFEKKHFDEIIDKWNCFHGRNT